MWVNASEYQYKTGNLFLGTDHNGINPIGVDTERHAITIAGAGAGKGACVIVPNLKRWPHSVLVIDPKGEAAELTVQDRDNMGQAVYVVDPFKSTNVPDRFQANFNPLDFLDVTSLTIKEDINVISDGIVMRGHDPSSTHWDDGTQAVISGLIAYIKLVLPPEQQNLIELRAIVRDKGRFWDAMEQSKKLLECAGVAQAGASAAFAKEGEYFVSGADKNTAWLDSKAMIEVFSSSSFSLADLKRNKISVFLVLPANYLGQHGRFLRLFVRCAIDEMARKTQSNKLRQTQCLFLLDEFYSLGYIEEISKAAGLMRGYGLQLWPILQDLGQLISLYGREGADTFLGNADIHQFFGNTDQTTLNHMSLLSGTITQSDIGFPPISPTTSQSPSYLASMTQQASHGGIRAAGGLIGSITDGLQNSSNAELNTNYQNAMSLYQQRASSLGRPKYTTNEMAEHVQKKSDVVANLMFCVLKGADNLFVKPAPFFRPAPDEITQSLQEEVTEINEWDTYSLDLKILFTVSVLFMCHLTYLAWLATENILATIILAVIIFFVTDFVTDWAAKIDKNDYRSDDMSWFELIKLLPSFFIIIYVIIVIGGYFLYYFGDTISEAIGAIIDIFA